MVVDVAATMGFKLKEMMYWRNMDSLNEEINAFISKERGGEKASYG